MPRIRRWFHVSHDINSDGEVWELTDKFGVLGLRLWLELLSIADRNEGRLPELSDSTVRQLSIKCNSSQTRVRLALDFTMTKLWIVSDPLPRVRNWAIYNPLREDKKSQTVSPPNPPNPPNPPKDKEALFVLPDWIPQKSWRDYEEHRRKMRTPLSTRAKELAVKQLELLRKEGHEPADVLDNCIARGWRGIFAPKENGSKPLAPKPRAKLERPPDLTEEQIEKNKFFLKDLLGKIGAKG